MTQARPGGTFEEKKAPVGQQGIVFINQKTKDLARCTCNAACWEFYQVGSVPYLHLLY